MPSCFFNARLSSTMSKRTKLSFINLVRTNQLFLRKTYLYCGSLLKIPAKLYLVAFVTGLCAGNLFAQKSDTIPRELTVDFEIRPRAEYRDNFKWASADTLMPQVYTTQRNRLVLTTNPTSSDCTRRRKRFMCGEKEESSHALETLISSSFFLN